MEAYCYSGPAGTDNIGICHGSTTTCTAGVWSACLGEVTPAENEDCNALDDNCDGRVDENVCGGGGGTSGRSSYCGDGYCMRNREDKESCPEDCGFPSCEEDWECTDWNECQEDGTRSRICTDNNDCGTEENKTIEEETCILSVAPAPVICAEGSILCDGINLVECIDGTQWEVIESCDPALGCDSDLLSCKEPEPIPDESPITGLFFGISDMVLYGLLIIVLMALFGTVYWKKKKGN